MSIYYLSGTTKWCSQKLDTKFPDSHKYNLDLYLDAASQASYKSTGIRVRAKEDKEGETFYKFSRGEKLTKKDGTEVILGPFPFLNADGTPYTGLVGNDSKVTVKISTYDTAAGLGHRVEAVRIDDLVKYERAETAVPTEGLPF